MKKKILTCLIIALILCAMTISLVYAASECPECGCMTLIYTIVHFSNVESTCSCDLYPYTHTVYLSFDRQKWYCTNCNYYTYGDVYNLVVTH